MLITSMLPFSVCRLYSWISLLLLLQLFHPALLAPLLPGQDDSDISDEKKFVNNLREQHGIVAMSKGTVQEYTTILCGPIVIDFKDFYYGTVYDDLMKPVLRNLQLHKAHSRYTATEFPKIANRLEIRLKVEKVKLKDLVKKNIDQYLPTTVGFVPALAAVVAGGIVVWALGHEAIGAIKSYFGIGDTDNSKLFATMLEAVEEKYEYEVMSLVDEKMEKYWEHNIQLVKNDLMEVLQNLFIHRIVNRKLFASEEQFTEIMKNVIGRQHFEDSIYKIFPKKALRLLEIEAMSRPSNSKIIAEICAPLVGTEELATEYSLFQVEPFGTISHGPFILPVLPGKATTALAKDFVDVINRYHLID